MKLILRTPAQAARLAAAHAEAKAGGTVITTRQLPGPAALIVVTDHDPADGQTVRLIMNRDGNYLPTSNENAGERS